MTVKIMTGEVCHSKHANRAEAEAEIERVRRETDSDIQDLTVQIQEAQEYHDSLRIVED